MFTSSFNPSTRPPSRNDRGGGTSKNYVLPVPQGFSVRVFKGPTLSSRPYPAKVDLDYRPMSRADSLSRQSAHVSRQDTTRKLIKAAPEELSFSSNVDRRSYDKPAGTSGRYTIHPGTVADTFIYERSFASKSDLYLPSDMTSDDSESIFSVSTQVSGSSSSSSTSTETPQSTALLQIRTESPVSDRSCSPPAYAQRASTYPPMRSYSPPSSDMAPPSRPHSAGTNRGEYVPYASRPLPTPPVSTRLRKDSISLASERVMQPSDVRPRLTSVRLGDRPYEHVPGQHAAPFPSAPAQRSTEDRGYTAPRGTHPSTAQDASNAHTAPAQISRSTSLKRNGSYGVPPPPGLDIVSSAQREYPPMQMTMSPDDFYEDDTPHRAPPVVPHRRNSDGDQPHIMPPMPVRSNTAPPARSVRWNDNLICPSPILPCQRRKGFFNRRGDQLWTNAGAYKPPAPGQDYPLDLDDYPEPGEGWQNEDGVRIDLNHRRIPKLPLRPALKPTNYNYLEHINIAGLITSSPASVESD
ncbi:hypothetical protein BV22DRAFT_465046 [Leucogyrophana mollusca]|uniref:Uncharacterized protein n=1 Tax=Leucogyrophana mollusca TaxID=85980 RepID=A0ACB8BGW2_9AGAM|nr:hypothetical protein BV22DRAFT_465046 [Leucogyrophana mollusca]